jgi:hypothetical protein
MPKTAGFNFLDEYAEEIDPSYRSQEEHVIPAIGEVESFLEDSLKRMSEKQN